MNSLIVNNEAVWLVRFYKIWTFGCNTNYISLTSGGRSSHNGSREQVVWLYWAARTYAVAKQQKVLLKFSDGSINLSQGKNVKTELNGFFFFNL
jgi:hypothetical protein